jgi:hypothetical protein
MHYPLDIPFHKIAAHMDLDARTGAFGVYLSPIDYDDNIYMLIDSIMDERGITRIAKFQDYAAALQFATDLHRAIMKCLSLDDLQQRHSLQLSAGGIEQITGQSQIAIHLSQFYYADSEFKVIPWCEAQGLDLQCLKFDENELEEEWEEEDEHLIQWNVMDELMEKQQYDRLDQLREALKIGKFAFVHPTPGA